MRWSWTCPLWIALAATAWGQDAAPLAPEVAEQLDALQPLVGPPEGASRLVRVEVPRLGPPKRTFWRRAVEPPPAEEVGWLVGEGAAARVVLLGGLSVPARDAKPIDFVAQAEAFYTGEGSALDLDPSTSYGTPDHRPVVHAAWLRARGRDDLAARAWALSERELGGRSVAHLRDELGPLLGGRIRDAYAGGHDVEAWALLTFVEAQGLRELELSTKIRARLAPRAAVGRLGRPPKRPAGWTGASAAERLAWTLAEALPEVRQRGDRRVLRRLECLDEPLCVLIARGLALVARAPRLTSSAARPPPRAQCA